MRVVMMMVLETIELIRILDIVKIIMLACKLMILSFRIWVQLFTFFSLRYFLFRPIVLKPPSQKSTNIFPLSTKHKIIKFICYLQDILHSIPRLRNKSVLQDPNSSYCYYFDFQRPFSM